MLKAKQVKCIELLNAGELNQKQIAKKLKITEQTICNWKKKTEFVKATGCFGCADCKLVNYNGLEF